MTIDGSPILTISPIKLTAGGHSLVWEATITRPTADPWTLPERHWYWAPATGGLYEGTRPGDLDEGVQVLAPELWRAPFAPPARRRAAVARVMRAIHIPDVTVPPRQLIAA